MPMPLILRLQDRARYGGVAPLVAAAPLNAGGIFIAAIDFASETDTGQAIGGVEIGVAGLAAETDTATALAGKLAGSSGLAAEG
jgi:hypothetical protein